LNRFGGAIRAPKFRNHFSLRGERSFRLRLLLRFVNMEERELRGRHQNGFAKLLIQLVRHVVHCAPAFLMRPASRFQERQRGILTNSLSPFRFGTHITVE
jgi:hypothetical protein